MPVYKGREVDLYYEVKGEGKPLVFTHGASWNHKQWRPQVDAFSRRYQTVVWDIRGHGASSLPHGKVDSEDFSRDLADLLSELGIEQATLCGLSLGGHISLQTAVRYPEKVAALILIGTPFTNAFNWFERMFVPVNRLTSYLMPMSLSEKYKAGCYPNIIRAIKPILSKLLAPLPIPIGFGYGMRLPEWTARMICTKSGARSCCFKAKATR